MSTSFATVSSTPYFGRAWKLQIITSTGVVLTTGSQSFDVNDESLKVTFKTSVTARIPQAAFAFADISIYNLHRAAQQTVLSGGDQQQLTTGNVIQQANLVTLFAGYQTNFQAQSLNYVSGKTGIQPAPGPVPAASTSLIWTGEVFQPMWERVNVTDYKLTLHCLIGYSSQSQNLVNTSFGMRQGQSQLVQKIASSAINGISIDDVSGLNGTQLPRGGVLFGRPNDLITDFATTNYAAFYVGANGINVRPLQADSPSSPPDWVFGPPWPQNVTVQPKYPLQYTPTLLGTPQQTQDGVVFRVLMDSRPKLADTVALDLSAINQLPVYPQTDPNSNQYAPFIPSDLQFIIISIEHVGDTRGEDWYTEFTCINKTFWPVYAQFFAQAQTG